jgi:hypothetical protein
VAVPNFRVPAFRVSADQIPDVTARTKHWIAERRAVRDITFPKCVPRKMPVIFKDKAVVSNYETKMRARLRALLFLLNDAHQPLCIKETSGFQRLVQDTESGQLVGNRKFWNNVLNLRGLDGG